MNNDNVRQLRQPQGFVLDTLVNLLSGLGTSKDKTASTVFTFDPVNKSQLLFAYRGDWVARKIVDAPAQDATREWREWQAEKKEITQVEDAEKALRLQAKVKSAIQRSRLFGGAALVMGVDQGNPESELRIDKVRKGQLKYVHVLNRDEISVPELDLDVQSEFFAEPKMYVVTSPRTGSIQVHPSRVIRFIGNEIPDIGSSTDGWGDSILQTVHDAVIHAGQTIANVAGIVNEAKIDVINIPGMMENMGTQEYRTRLTERFTLANTIKSITNTLMLDKEEEWNRLQASFAGLPDLIRVYLLIASGAADIPATRMLGQSASGFNATGTEDTRNYYDRVASDQKNDIAPRLDRLDEVMLRSIFGDKPDEFFYEWRSLWQMTETEKADVATKKATAFTADVNAGLLPPEVLREARENQLIEDGTYPGLEAAIEEYGAQNLDEYNQGVLQQMQARAALTAPDDPNDPNAAKKKAKAAQLELQRRKALPPPRPPTARGGDALIDDDDDEWVDDAFDPEQPRDPHGRWSSGASAGASLSAKEQDTVHAAQLHLKEGHLEGMKVEKFAGRASALATSKGNNTYLNPALLQEHPAYIAGILFHENVHRLGQKGTSAEKELDAHNKTKGWAFTKALHAKDPKEKAAFERVFNETRAEADRFARQVQSQKQYRRDSLTEDETTPRSLYVRRDVLNGAEILAHFEEQGVDVSGVDPDELHVTVLYSRQPVDWIKMGESSYGHIGRGEDLDDGVDMCVRAGGPRVMEAYGTPPDTLVMCFASSALCWRHQDMMYKGASSDYEDYNPHVSIAPWDGRNVRLVEPWQGEILLGPEIFEPTKTGGAAGVAADYDPSEPRAAAGSAVGGQWTREGAGSWAGRLHESMRDNAGFDAVVAELKSSKVTQPQMHKIATEFFTLELGHDPGYARSKSKGELLRKIVDWQALDARQRARLASHASDYDPSEPRAAAGSAQGGQWTREGAAAARQSRIDKVERERRARAEGDISARLRRTREAAVAKSRRITAAAAHKAIEFMRDKENRIEGVGVIADQLSGMFAGLDEVSSKMVRQMTADLARHFGDDVEVARGAVRRALSKAIEIRRGLTGDADEPEADDEILQTLLALLAMLGRETKGEVVDWRSALDYSPDQPRVPRGKEGGGQFTTQGGAGYSAVLRQAGIHARLIKVKRLESGKSFNAVYKKQPLNPQGNPQVIEVAQQVRGVRGKWNKNADQAGDFAAGAGWVALKEVPELGRFADQFWRDAAEFMTPKEYEYAKPYFATRDTAFTEGFRAAYSPNGKAFGLSRARTEEVFGRSTAQLRSGITEVFSPPKPGALARVGEKIAKLFGA